MRQNSNQRRGRSRNNQNRRPGRNQSFDSNGPSVRLRGTAAQLNEKYQALARDATSAGDRVMAENYHQHADHYYRVMISLNPPQTREEDRQPDLTDVDEIQPLDGRGRGDRGQAQGGQGQRAQNQGSQSQDRQDRRDNRNRRGRDRQEDGDAPAAETGEEVAADGKPGAEGEPRNRTRRQSARRQDSDPRRRSGGRADEAVPGDEPLDQGLHRILGGGAEKGRQEDAAEPPAGDGADSDDAVRAAASGDTASDGGSEGDGAGEGTAAGHPSGPDAAADAAPPAEEAPKPRTRRRKPAAEAEEAAPAEPVADAAV